MFISLFFASLAACAASEEGAGSQPKHIDEAARAKVCTRVAACEESGVCAIEGFSEKHAGVMAGFCGEAAAQAKGDGCEIFDDCFTCCSGDTCCSGCGDTIVCN